MIAKYRSLVNGGLGSTDGALIFDESGFVKKGKDSTGAARQYCGNLGKTDNCQTGVFAACVSEHGYALADKRLFIPEKWFNDDYSERRIKCKLPADTVFQTKPRLAAEMMEAVCKENVLPFKYILAGSLYGNSPEFIASAEALPGKTYFAAVPKGTQPWLKRPMTIAKTYCRVGKTRTKAVLADTGGKPVSADQLARNISGYF